MASGPEHEKSTRWWAAPFALTIGLIFDVQSGLISGIAFLVGGLWLSPDLDTNSIALRRWGILKGLWWPYRKMIKHRSILSHSPFIGTVLRVGYLLAALSLLLFLIQSSGFADTLKTKYLLDKLITQNPKFFGAILLGLEASTWLHLAKDGDPLPKKWHK